MCDYVYGTLLGFGRRANGGKLVDGAGGFGDCLGDGVKSLTDLRERCRLLDNGR